MIGGLANDGAKALPFFRMPGAAHTHQPGVDAAAAGAQGARGAPGGPAAGSQAADVPGLPPAVPHLPQGWWHSLPRVHYASFGARHGILPRLSNAEDAAITAAAAAGGSQHADTAPGAGAGAGGGTVGRGVVVVFEDRVDAEFVAGALHVGLTRGEEAALAAQALAAAAAEAAGVTVGELGLGSSSGDGGSRGGGSWGAAWGDRVSATTTQPPPPTTTPGGSSAAGQGAQPASLPLPRTQGIPRPQVVAGNPAHLGDVSQAQGMELGVVPRGVLPAYYGTQVRDGG